MKSGRAIVLIFLLAGCSSLRPAPDSTEVAGSRLTAPAGFKVNLFAEGLGDARFMAFDPQGRLMVCDMGEGRVLTLPDQDHDGRADRVIVFARDLPLAHSLAWYRGKAYVAGGTHVWELTDQDGDGVADQPRVLVDNLPARAGHITRTIAFGPDGKMYVSVGSSSNIQPERDPRRAAVLRFDSDGGHPEIFATGLRNSVGLAFHPQTHELWGTDNGRDRLGEDLPPDELNIIRRGGFYGWPWYYGNNIPDPAFRRRPRGPGIPAALEFQAHSAPLGLCFYTGMKFPAEYRGQCFVCFHGSWNRQSPTGYQLVLVQVRNGRPVSYRSFLTGFLTEDGTVTGRPVDVKMGPDGSLYFSDDLKGRIYRVSWDGSGARETHGGRRTSHRGVRGLGVKG